TALRETEEEIGVDRNAIEVWGGLNTEWTRASKYWITPFVGLVPYPYDFQPNDFEVERLIIVPFAHLLDPETFSVDEYSWRGGSYTTYLYTCGEDVIWGLTARILYNFIYLLTTGREPEDYY
ncbi:MAG: CoA pyrophosphatase, partial [Proteobacteria bacterium]|nr:CoA pyrophosphatase [Pseudomonadota bacterium]